MKRFFVFDGESYDDSYTTAEAARAAAEEALMFYQREAEFGGEWSDSTEHVAWGEVRGFAKMISFGKDEDGEDAGCNYVMTDTDGV